MSMKRLSAIALGVVAVAGWNASALAADAAAGKAKFASACAECHEAADFEGEDAAALTDTLKKIVAKQAKHKQALTLSDAEIANLAAYMATGGK